MPRRVARAGFWKQGLRFVIHFVRLCACMSQVPTWCGFATAKSFPADGSQMIRKTNNLAAGCPISCTHTDCPNLQACDAACFACATCGGFRYQPNGGGSTACWFEGILVGTTMFVGSFDDAPDDGKGDGWKLRINSRSPACSEQTVCWQGPFQGQYLGGCVTGDGCANHRTAEAAKTACIAAGSACGGILTGGANHWNIRRSSTPIGNTHETSFVKIQCAAVQSTWTDLGIGDCRAPTNDVPMRMEAAGYNIQACGLRCETYAWCQGIATCATCLGQLNKCMMYVQSAGAAPVAPNGWNRFGTARGTISHSDSSIGNHRCFALGVVTTTTTTTSTTTTTTTTTTKTTTTTTTTTKTTTTTTTTKTTTTTTKTTTTTTTKTTTATTTTKTTITTKTTTTTTTTKVTTPSTTTTTLTTLTTTTTYYEVLEGTLTMTVSNVSQFINDPNVRAPLTKAIANMSGVNETWVKIDNITSSQSRRLNTLDFVELHVRMLSGPGFTSTLSNGAKVNFHVEVRHDGSTFVTAEIVKSRISAVALLEASKLVNMYLDAGTFGSNKYNVQVQYKFVKVRPKRAVIIPTDEPSPSPSSNNRFLILICIMASCSVILVASCLRAYCKWVVYRRSEKIKFHSVDMSTLSDKTAANLLHPPPIIMDDDRFACFDFLRSMLDPSKGSESDVYLTFAVGKRQQDAQLSGPGMYHAAAITKALHDRGIICHLSLPGFNDVTVEAAYQQPIFCKLLLVLETHALFTCMKSLEEIDAAFSNNVEVMRVRIEAGLPEESMQWPTACISDEMRSLRILYNVILPWSEKPLLGDDHYIDYCADELKMKLGVLKSSKLVFKAAQEKMAMVRPGFYADCFQVDPEHEPLIGNRVSCVSGLPEGFSLVNAGLKSQCDAAEPTPMAAKFEQIATGSLDVKTHATETGSKDAKNTKKRVRPKPDLPRSDPKSRVSTTVAAAASHTVAATLSRPLKTGSRGRLQSKANERNHDNSGDGSVAESRRGKSTPKPDASRKQCDAASISSASTSPMRSPKKSRQRSTSKKKNAARSADRTSSEKALDVKLSGPATMKEMDESAVMIQKVVRGNAGRQLVAKKKQELKMSVDKRDATTNRGHSHMPANTFVIEDFATAQTCPTPKTKGNCSGVVLFGCRKKKLRGSSSPSRRNDATTNRDQSHMPANTPVTEDFATDRTCPTPKTKAELRGSSSLSRRNDATTNRRHSHMPANTPVIEDFATARACPTLKTKAKLRGSSSPSRRKRNPAAGSNAVAVTKSTVSSPARPRAS